jgi:hypothetical protein
MPDFTQTRIWQRTLGPGGDQKDSAAKEILRSAYNNFRSRAAALAGEIQRDLPDFTVHDVTHLDALWEMADIVVESEYPITPTEAFILGGAFLIHDLGLGLAAYPGGAPRLEAEPLWLDVLVSNLREKLGRQPTQGDFVCWQRVTSYGHR